MTQMLDTEGSVLPVDERGNPEFDIYLACNDKCGRGPYLALGIPMSFECEGGTYDSAGVLTVEFEEVLQEYLKDFDMAHGGGPIPEFVSLLRTYADRFEEAYKLLSPERRNLN